MRPRLLYISVNDGTDTRIIKEISSLSRDFEITFIGVYTPSSSASMLPPACRTFFIHGLRRSSWTIMRIFWRVAILRPWSFQSTHVINENLALALYPLLLLSKNWVLDVFDSLFLKSTSRWVNASKSILQRLIYGSAHTILVTDEVRLNLLPSWARAKARVLPNFPLAISSTEPRHVDKNGPLKIFFSGSLGIDRGIPFLLNLIKQDPTVKIHAAGWLYDKVGEDFCRHPQVHYHGVLHQTAAAKITQECDYILCLYQPNIPNNIYASPNKIYDGIQAGVPVIINAEVMVADFVRQQKLGYILPSYNPGRLDTILSDLKSQRSDFGHIQAFKEKYTWERVEDVLITAHSYRIH